MNLDRFAQELWYERRHRPVGFLLLPLSWLFEVIVSLRLWLYRAGALRATRVTRPVIVVGNLTVGGTGKTPFVAWLAGECARRGYRAAIICGGYGGSQRKQVSVVRATSDPRLVGDEAVLLAQLHPDLVIAGANRVEAARLAVQLNADVVISDDGLQHYSLARDCSLLVIDGARGFGNERLLPAGPLREPLARSRAADARLVTQRSSQLAIDVPDAIRLHSQLGRPVSLLTKEVRDWREFVARPVHVVTGIGHPDAFLAMLEAQGLQFDARVLPDHAAISAADLAFSDSNPVLMTDKDAVKCQRFADARLWRVPLEISIAAEDQARLWSVLDPRLRARTH